MTIEKFSADFFQHFFNEIDKYIFFYFFSTKNCVVPKNIHTFAQIIFTDESKQPHFASLSVYLQRAVRALRWQSVRSVQSWGVCVN